MNNKIKIMISQFCVSIGRIQAMIGAKNFVYDNTSNSIKFHFSLCKIANICELKYEELTDLYTITFYKYRPKKMICDNKKEYTGIYNDQLKSIFEGYTGLYISL